MDVIYTDFSKAFDKLDHELLLNKLDSFGFSPNLISLIKSYLCDREQFVEYRGYLSQHFVQTSGVPQGSILGPMLFNIFVNDICTNISPDTHYLQYADDLKILKKVNTLDDCVSLQQNLNAIVSWCGINNIVLNTKKCQVMSYSRKLVDNTIVYPYQIDDILLCRPECVKDLGVTFDTKLSFNQHVENICNQSTKRLGLVIRNSSFFERSPTVEILFKALVRPCLEYAAVVWAPSYHVHIDNLEKVQRRFLKYLAFRHDKVYPPQGFPQEALLNRFEYLSLEYRRSIFYIKLLFLILNNGCDCAVMLHSLNFHVPRLNARSNILFETKTPRTNMLEFSPLYNMLSRYTEVEHIFDLFAFHDISQLTTALNNYFLTVLREINV